MNEDVDTIEETQQQGSPMKSKPGSKHSAGGSTFRPLPPGVAGAAIFGGKNDEYRYRLHRTWGPGRRVLFVMMNPSTADPLFDDDTVYKCYKYARTWGFDGLDVGNTFAYRTTDQKVLTKVVDPIGPDNDLHLTAMATAASLIVFAFGLPGSKALRARGPAVAMHLRDHAGIKCHMLKLTKNGTPWHPLYLKDELKASIWNF
jgi:hypothetical protein